MIWNVLGIAVGVAAFFCIVASELLRAFPKLEAWRTILAGVLAALGVAVWLAGKIRARARSKPQAEEQENISARLGLPFWGAMLVVLAGIVLFIQPLRRSEPVRHLPLTATPVVPTNKLPTNIMPTNIIQTPVTNRAVAFPPLKIQGLILADGNPVVLIDGKSFGVGEEVKGCTVKSVKRDGVLMEKDGATQFYKVD